MAASQCSTKSGTSPAEALVGFTDASVAINATIDPGTEIEIIVEATGPGSFPVAGSR
jgi:hypothetical protein